MRKRIIGITIILVLTINSFGIVLATDNSIKNTNKTNNNEAENREDEINNNNNNQINYEEQGNNNIDKSNEEKIEKDLSNNLKENLYNIEEKNNNEEIKSELNTVEEDFSIYTIVDGLTINSYKKNNVYYLFLPKSANLQNIELIYTGDIDYIDYATFNETTKTITGQFNNGSELNINLKNEETVLLKIMQSDLPYLHINNITTLDTNSNVSIDDVSNRSKEEKYNASAFITNGINSKENISDTIEFKGRGNFTWELPKKAYQIKFNKKKSVLGMDKAKTWILLANYTDNSYARNKTAFDLANEVGLKYTPDYRYIDLWADGNYIGLYLVTEKVQVNENRVDLIDEEGILSELDNTNYDDEQNWFISDYSKTFFTLKDSVADDVYEPQSISLKAFDNFKKQINLFEKNLYAEKPDWNKIKNIIDVDSFVYFYFIQELSEDPDGMRSSLFLYKDGGKDLIHMGPVWDYDSAFGNYTEEKLGGNPDIDYVINISNYMEVTNDWYAQLFRIKEFREELANTYKNKIRNIFKNINIGTNNDIINSTEMNDIIWETLGKKSPFGRINKTSYNEEVNYLNEWIQKRIEYLDNRYSENSPVCNISYSSHVQDYGWERTDAKNGIISGTEGEAKRLEAIRIYLDTFNENVNTNMLYKVHVQDYGWQKWNRNGEIAGTIGEGKRIEAIMIKPDNKRYSVKYRTHIEDYGWSDWKYDGEIAGTTGQGKRIEAIEIELVDNISAIGSERINENALISYSGHIESIGDTGYFSDGEILGTHGKGLRLEGLKLYLQIPEEVGITINEHIQDIGWKYNLNEKNYIGTKGEGKRIEAISLKLVGKDAESYSIKYRVHIQDIGWQDWKNDGKIAGTTGLGKRIEAIQIKIDSN